MPAPREADSLSKIFVGGLASTTGEDELKQFYEQWGGEITDIVVMRDPTTKRSRGFGFVTFAIENQVDTAMENRPHVINGKQVDPKRAIPREFQNKAEAQVPSKKVYVGGIKPEHTADILRDYFTKFGGVQDIDVVEDKKTGQLRGFAFVSFDDTDPADKVVLMRNHTINGKRCECKKAVSKDELARIQQHGDSMARGARSRGPAPGGYPPYGNAADNGYGSPRGGAGANWNAPYNPAPYNQYGAGPQNQYGGGPYGGAPQQSQWGAQPPVDPSYGAPAGGPGGYGGYNAAPNPYAGGYPANGVGYGNGAGAYSPAAVKREPSGYGAGAPMGNYGSLLPNQGAPQGWKNAASYGAGRTY